MLFSDDKVAEFINVMFEPVCMTVREVPLVTIDFGGNRIVTRTLRGNIATFILSPDAVVLDVLPGIYDRDTYVDQLSQLRMLFEYIYLQLPKEKRAQILGEYHETQAKQLRKKQPGRRFTYQTAGLTMSKRWTEKSAMRVIFEGDVIPAPPKPATIFGALWKTKKDEAPPANLAEWSLLKKDAEANESISRLQIHEKLAQMDNPAPAGLTKWVYKEVLHADLDDPYLGLGAELFDDYPFRHEDG